jgi:hypothetical protein
VSLAWTVTATKHAASVKAANEGMEPIRGFGDEGFSRFENLSRCHLEVHRIG